MMIRVDGGVRWERREVITGPLGLQLYLCCSASPHSQENKVFVQRLVTGLRFVLRGSGLMFCVIDHCSVVRNL
jgi:hypothetical protein